MGGYSMEMLNAGSHARAAHNSSAHEVSAELRTGGRCVIFLSGLGLAVLRRCRHHTTSRGGPHRIMGVRRLLVADHQFILATRDTGYRGVANAVAELIDNSIQAGASDVRVFVREGAGKDERVAT